MENFAAALSSAPEESSAIAKPTRATAAMAEVEPDKDVIAVEVYQPGLAQLLGLVHVVRRDDQGDALALEPEEPVPQDVPGLGVEARRRLVEEQDLRVVDEGPGDRQAALHAAGERLDRVRAALGELGEVEELVGALTDHRPRQPEVAPVDVEVLLHGDLHVEVVLLRAVAEAGPHRCAVGDRVEAEDPQLAAARGRGRGDHLHRRGLAGAVGPEEAEGLSLRHLDVDGVDRGEVPEGLGQTGRAEQDPLVEVRGTSLVAAHSGPSFAISGGTSIGSRSIPRRRCSGTARSSQSASQT